MLSKIFKKNITVYGCGRTDAGVHASQYIAHIKLDTPPTFDLKYRLNKNLPTPIAIHHIYLLPEGHHARYDATSRTYDYFIHRIKDPFLSAYTAYYEYDQLDLRAMQAAATLYKNGKDYMSVCKQPLMHKHTICKVTEALLFASSDKNRIRLTITSNRFLRGMIRICITNLLKVGTGVMSLDALQERLDNPRIVPQQKPALPQGLYLSRITYSYLEYEPRQNMTDILSQGMRVIEK